MPDPYSGGRSLVARARRVDEDALVRRYAEDKWSVPRCAAAFGIGRGRVDGILRRRGVEMRGVRRQLDPDDVLRAYATLGNYTAVATALGANAGRVMQILDDDGVPHDSSPDPVCETASVRKAARRRRRLAAEPSPPDVLSPSQAARVSGMSTRELLALSRQGQLRNYGNAYFPRYRRGDVTAAAGGPARKTPAPVT